MAIKQSGDLKIIGIHELVHFPKAGLKSIPAKTDTGAYNCAIDCSFTEITTNSKGNKVLRYTLLSPKHPQYTGKVHRTKKFKTKTVRSSNGIETHRYQVRLKIELKGKVYRTTFNLSTRDTMRYPILLGRKFLAKRFLVDVSKNRKTKTLGEMRK